MLKNLGFPKANHQLLFSEGSIVVDGEAFTDDETVTPSSLQQTFAEAAKNNDTDLNQLNPATNFTAQVDGMKEVFSLENHSFNQTRTQSLILLFYVSDGAHQRYKVHQ